MGASVVKNGPLCCGAGGATGSNCCAKNAGKSMEIQARPMGPGLQNSDDIANDANGKAGDGVWVAGKDDQQEGQDGDHEETYEDGSTYAGQIMSGRRHGHGVWTSTAEQYSGQWKEDQRDGQGQQQWQDGRVYVGQFKEGRFDGVGRMEWYTPHGLMVYDGQYENDMKHGEGKYIWPDKRIYQGQWVRGKRSGRAIYTNTVGQQREGIWKDDQIERWLDGGDPSLLEPGATEKDT